MHMLFTIKGVYSFLTLDVTLIVRGELIILCGMYGFPRGISVGMNDVWFGNILYSKGLPEWNTEQLQGVPQNVPV